MMFLVIVLIVRTFLAWRRAGGHGDSGKQAFSWPGPRR